MNCLINLLNTCFIENKIRLVWDFRGVDALKTTEHQLTHLIEFMKKKKTFLIQISHQNRLVSFTLFARLLFKKTIWISLKKDLNLSVDF